MEEFNQAQSITAQPVHASTERRNRQIVLVDAESGRETWQIGSPEGRLNGDIQVREAEGSSEETGRSDTTAGGPWTSDERTQRCHPFTQ